MPASTNKAIKLTRKSEHKVYVFTVEGNRHVVMFQLISEECKHVAKWLHKRFFDIKATIKKYELQKDLNKKDY